MAEQEHGSSYQANSNSRATNQKGKDVKIEVIYYIRSSTKVTSHEISIR